MDLAAKDKFVLKMCHWFIRNDLMACQENITIVVVYIIDHMRNVLLLPSAKLTKP